ncbi:hypothetical protein CJJ19_11220 (plasmid) [Candidatus Williamhamiltonella defendens]|nr:type 4b pilus protein PilO2 [Candidatus Hamiltonella defensa]AYB49981.1 hypothetical protein CJJ19_11220 [Candidatus Hamiltonella defensa]
MTTIPGLAATSMVRGRRVFLAGIDWLPVTLRAGKNVKSEARRQGADRVVSYRYRDRQKHPQWVMGLVNWSALALPKGCKDGYALALLIVPQLKGSGYAIIAIDRTHYGFVSSIDGVLINDLVGDKATIVQTQKNFLQFNPEPEGAGRCSPRQNGASPIANLLIWTVCWQGLPFQPAPAFRRPHAIGDG